MAVVFWIAEQALVCTEGEVAMFAGSRMTLDNDCCVRFGGFCVVVRVGVLP